MISAETYNADYEKAIKFGYNKGIEEFAEKLKAKCNVGGVFVGYEIRRMIEKLAEQLKGE